jgi:hypothetical protein
MSVTFSINPDDGSLSWVSNNPTNIPDVIITKGGTQGNGCGYFNPDELSAGDKLGDLNNKLEYTGIKSAQACTDNKRNPISQAVLQVVKTVTTPEADCMTAGDLLNIEIADPSVGSQVKYCYTISNLGGGTAVIGSIVDDNGNGFDDPSCTTGTGTDTDCDDIYITPMNLAAGETTITSSLVTIFEAGTRTNVVVVDGSWTDPNDATNIVQLHAEDTATVVARQTVEPCPPDAQLIMDGTATGSEDNYDFMLTLDSQQPNRAAMCVPTSVKAKGIECVSECVPKDCASATVDCDLPENTTCEPSGVWNKDYDPATAAVLPYCWEVAMDRDRDGLYVKLSKRQTVHFSAEMNDLNPYTGTYCYTSGGRQTCYDYCYPKAGEPADVCNLQ